MPTTLLIAGLMNYVYEAPYAPLVTVHVPAGLAAGTALPIKLHMRLSGLHGGDLRARKRRSVAPI